MKTIKTLIKHTSKIIIYPIRLIGRASTFIYRICAPQNQEILDNLVTGNNNGYEINLSPTVQNNTKQRVEEFTPQTICSQRYQNKANISKNNRQKNKVILYTKQDDIKKNNNNNTQMINIQKPKINIRKKSIFKGNNKYQDSPYVVEQYKTKKQNFKYNRKINIKNSQLNFQDNSNQITDIPGVYIVKYGVNSIKIGRSKQLYKRLRGYSGYQEFGNDIQCLLLLKTENHKELEKSMHLFAKEQGLDRMGKKEIFICSKQDEFIQTVLVFLKKQQIKYDILPNIIEKQIKQPELDEFYVIFDNQEKLYLNHKDNINYQQDNINLPVININL